MRTRALAEADFIPSDTHSNSLKMRTSMQAIGRVSERLRAGLVALSALVAMGVVIPAPTLAGHSALVMTDHGPIVGAVLEGHRAFLGIPYAAPPVDDLRWESPQPMEPWTTPREATEPGNACVPNSAFGKGSDSEDCLYLNVTTPRSDGNVDLPVMVWIHGGGYQFGAGSEYDATYMAVRGNVVVVTINYRLGAFGFLAHPALNDEGDQLSGNYGLEDQQAALRWVQNNAAAFGGDPNNVTIVGQSSGARSVCAHLVSPASTELFHRAIIQSEPCTMADWPQRNGQPDLDPPGFPRPRARAEDHGMALAAELGCSDPATAANCLREVETDTLLERATHYFYGPVFDGGGVLPVDPAIALRSGQFARIPVIVGISRDEYRLTDALWEAFGEPPVTDAQYLERVEAWVGTENVADVLARYPLQDYDSPSEAWSAVITDDVFAKPAIDTVRALARHVPTFAYEFADRQAPWMTGLPMPSFPTGAYHTAELQYLFDTAGFDEPLSAAQELLSARMIHYWTQFAWTGDPGASGLPGWPTANHRTSVFLALDTGPGHIRPVNFDREHHYAFWAALDR